MAATSVTLGCDAAGFYGAGGAAAPQLFNIKPCSDAAPLAEDRHDSGALTVSRQVTLAPGTSTTYYNVYGYVPSGFTLDGLVAKYSNTTRLAQLRSELSQTWVNNTVQFTVA